MACQNSTWKGPLVAVSHDGLSLLYLDYAVRAASRRGSMTLLMVGSSHSYESKITFA
jgi:hypothetical protein